MVEQAPSNDRHIHLTANELLGLREIVLYLHSLPPTRKNIPDVLTNAAALIHDVRTLVEKHRKDQKHLAVTGLPVVTLRPLVSQKSIKKTNLSSVAGHSSSLLMARPDPNPSIASTSRPSVIVKKEILVQPVKEEEKKEESEEESEEIMFPPITNNPFPHLQNHFRQLQEQQQRQNQPTHVIRPALVTPLDPILMRKKASEILLGQIDDKLQLIFRPEILVPVFQYLSVPDLLICMQVCRSWNTSTIDPSLWKFMDFSHRQLTKIMLGGIIRRQPRFLILDWSSLNHQQCSWVMDRSPSLHSLSLQGCSAVVLGALKLPTPLPNAPFSRAILPKLTVLDLSWVSGLNDLLLERTIIMSTPNRLTNLKRLALAGADLTDRTLNSIASCFPILECLCIAYCLQFSSNGLRSLWMSNERLIRIDLSGCTQLSDDYQTLRCEAARVRPDLNMPDDITSDSQVVHRCIPISFT